MSLGRAGILLAGMICCSSRASAYDGGAAASLCAQWWHTLEDPTTYNDGHGDKYRPNYLNTLIISHRGLTLVLQRGKEHRRKPRRTPHAIEGKGHGLRQLRFGQR